MGRRSLLAVLGWLVAAAAATVTGLAAVRVIGDGITGSGGEVMTPQQVAAAAAGPTPTAATMPSPSVAVPTGQSSPSPPAVRRTAWSTPGGSIVAECDGTQVRLVSWAPAQGYQVKRADGHPDDHAEVTFEGSAGKVEVRVWCAAGQPEASWKEDD